MMLSLISKNHKNVLVRQTKYIPKILPFKINTFFHIFFVYQTIASSKEKPWQ